MSYLFSNFALFNDIEHDYIIEQMDNQEILNRAVAALNSNLHREKRQSIIMERFHILPSWVRGFSVSLNQI